MKNKHLFAFLSVLLCCQSGCAMTPASANLDEQQRSASRLQALTSESVIESDFSGVILIADRNEIIFEQAFNDNSLGDEFRVDLQTMFPIASITKSFTAVLILQLVDQKFIDLDDPIGAYLPALPADYAEHVSIRHLLQNRSGLPNYTELPGWSDADYKRSLTRDVLLREIADLPLKFEPGTEYHYSNANFYLLGRILEQVVGASYDDILSTNILLPLQMQHTGQIFDEGKSSEVAKNMVRGDDGAYHHLLVINPRVFEATASISATARDLFHWHLGLNGDKLLGDDMKRLMFDPSQPMAWTVGSVPLSVENELSIQTYNGELLGYTSMITRFPDHDGVVILLNNNDAGYDMLAELTLEIAIDLYDR